MRAQKVLLNKNQTSLWEGYDHYVNSCYPDGMPDQQELEIRQSFYTGFMMAVEVVRAFDGLPPHKQPEAAAKLTAEVESFYADIMARTPGGSGQKGFPA